MSDQQAFLSLREKRELTELIRMRHDGTLPEAETTRLVELVRQRVDGRARYFRATQLNSSLHWYFSPEASAIRAGVGAFLSEVCGAAAAASEPTNATFDEDFSVQIHCELERKDFLNRVDGLRALEASAGSSWTVRRAGHRIVNQPRGALGGMLAWLGNCLNSRPRRAFAFALVSVVVFTTLSFVAMRPFGRQQPSEVAMNSESNAIAVLVSVDNGHWKGRSLEVGSTLHREELELTSGTAVLEFQQGARVVLQGPARFDLQGKNHAALDFGKIAAYVPLSAHGFTIATPTVAVVDLGTEFGVEVTQQGEVEVAVLTGEVEIGSSAQSKGSSQWNEPQHTISAGQAATVRRADSGRLNVSQSKLGDTAATNLAKQLIAAKNESVKVVDFNNKPNWVGSNNTTNGNNYGWSQTADKAGKKVGEVGGTFARTQVDSFYGDVHLFPTLDLGRSITACGKFNIRNITEGWTTSGDSGLFIGHFSQDRNRPEFIGLEFKEENITSKMRVRARLQVSMKGDSTGAESEWSPISVHANHNFSYTYDPRAGNGRLTLKIDAMPPLVADLKPTERVKSAQFDAFGVGATSNLNSQDDLSKNAEVYLDDVSYSGCRGQEDSRQ